MKQLAIGVILALVSTVGFLVLYIPNIGHILYNSYRHKKSLGAEFKNNALAIDIMANVVFAPMLNNWFLKHNSYAFGKHGETMSSVFGKNQIIKGLTVVGIGFASILDLIEDKHCYISINDPVYYEIYAEPVVVKRRTTILVGLLVLTILISSFYLLRYLVGLFY